MSQPQTIDRTAQQEERVVLVDEANTPIGVAPKAEVHTGDTPLHRGFSAFIFDPHGRLLLQQRSAVKMTWPLTWSNSCCGHPAWGETAVQAARRRLRDELSLEAVALAEALPHYRYRAERDGIVENEICPVVVGVTSQQPDPDPAEVAAVQWVDWRDFVDSIRAAECDLSPWCEEEALLLDALPGFLDLLARLRANESVAG